MSKATENLENSISKDENEIIINKGIQPKISEYNHAYDTRIYNNFLQNNECKSTLDLLLFIILNKYVNDKKIYCNPCLKTLAIECKSSRSSIIRSLENLEKIKYIVVHNEFYHNGKTSSTIWVAQFNKITGNIDTNSLNVYQCLAREKKINIKK